MKLKETITTTDKDGAEVKIDILYPTAAIENEAQLEYLRKWNSLVKAGVMVGQVVDKYLTAQGLWDDEKQKQLDEIDQKLEDSKIKLRTAKDGDKRLTKEDGRAIALEMRKLRVERVNLLSATTQYRQNTAEGQAENYRFHKLVTLCTVRNSDRKPIFSSIDDYLNRSDEKVAVDSATKLAEMRYGVTDDWEKDLPENKFLLKYKFCDEKFRLINEDGHLISEDGKLINDEGRYVDPQGNYIDVDGNPVDKEGEMIVEEGEFL